MRQVERIFVLLKTLQKHWREFWAYITCPSSHVIPRSGVHCEINADDCTPFTDPVTKEPKCFNNGKCVDGVGGYHCICPAGYVGERCEGDVNECLSNPCDPRGTLSCIQLTNNYRCECRTGYTGEDLDRTGGRLQQFTQLKWLAWSHPQRFFILLFWGFFQF